MGGDSPESTSLGGEATPFRGAVVSKPTELLRAGRHRATISQKTICVCIREWLRPGCNPLQAARAGGWAGKKIEIKSDEKEKRGKEKATRKEEKKKGKTIQIIFLVFKKNKEEKDSGQPIRMRSTMRGSVIKETIRIRAPHLQTSGSTSKIFLSRRAQGLRASLAKSELSFSE